MRTLLIILSLIYNLYADYTHMLISDYINVVATQNNINIATDNQIKKEFNFYINKPIGGKTNIAVLKEMLDSNGYALVKKSKNYYIIKNKKDLLINKIKIFHVNFADTKIIKEKAEKIIKGYYKNIKTTSISSKDKKFTPMKERSANDGNSDVKVQETETKLNYSINVLDNKTIAVTYKDRFVPQVINTIIKSIDKKPQVIRVTTKIYEVNTNALKKLGAQLTANGDLGVKFNNFSTDTSTGAIKLNAEIGSKVPSLNTLGVDLVITALEKKGDAHLMSEPSILLYEGKSSTLVQGKTFPIQKQNTQVNNQNTTSTTSYKEQDTGLTIKISFEQYRSGYIYLDFNLNISGVESYDQQTQQLITFKRELINNMIITPGQRINLAGLNTKNDTTSKGGIPVLKEIPWLGRLFEFEQEEHTDNMLVIQLKAELVK